MSGEGYNTQESYADRNSKATETHSGLDVEGHISKQGSIGFKIPRTNIGISADVGGSIKGATGTGARNVHDLSHDMSSQQNQSYQESLDRVRGYAKTHDDRDSYGNSETLTSGLQATWREQEQIAHEQAQTYQKMQQYQQQQSYISQHQSSIDQNWNDEVLEAVQARNALANKQDALTHLNEHSGKGRQVLDSLIAAKYNSMLPQEMQQKSLDLQAKVDHNLKNETINPEKEKEKLQTQFGAYQLPDTIKQQVAEHIDSKRRSEIEHKAQSLDEKSFPDHMRGKFEEQQKQFNDESGSTLYRTGKEATDNVGAAFSGALEKGKKLLTSIKDKESE